MCSKVFTVDILSFLFHFELCGEMSGQKGGGGVLLVELYLVFFFLTWSLKLLMGDCFCCRILLITYRYRIIIITLSCCGVVGPRVFQREGWS